MPVLTAGTFVPNDSPGSKVTVQEKEIKTLNSAVVFEEDDKERSKSFAINKQNYTDLAYAIAQAKVVGLNLEDAKRRLADNFVVGFIADSDTEKSFTTEKDALISTSNKKGDNK